MIKKKINYIILLVLAADYQTTMDGSHIDNDFFDKYIDNDYKHEASN